MSFMEQKPPLAGNVKKEGDGGVRSVESKARNPQWLLRQGLLWANSPVVSPVRLDVGRMGFGRGRAPDLARR
ncbi:hypothetical protein GCM10010508_29980 [Streptomyces naganishii JCM 4654]|uniref:Uncharacterized protein n=1 Tax=Streptomyces naganishii JCM 4654 TaxID=1306179 RepID=A0A919CV70_9ACTN|nr:hypothetical protein GCM10010508_29980 [Streptomyces naganishii JCM 4654]